MSETSKQKVDTKEFVDPSKPEQLIASLDLERGGNDTIKVEASERILGPVLRADVEDITTTTISRRSPDAVGAAIGAWNPLVWALDYDNISADVFGKETGRQSKTIRMTGTPVPVGRSDWVEGPWADATVTVTSTQADINETFHTDEKGEGVLRIADALRHATRIGYGIVDLQFSATPPAPGAQVRKTISLAADEIDRIASANGVAISQRRVAWGTPVNAPANEPAPAGVPLANDKTVELAFWKSVDANGSIEDYQAYLRRYPDGDFSEIASHRIAALQQQSRQHVIGGPSLEGKRVALVIGNASYRHVPRLDNTLNDARLIATTLKRLGFELVGGQALTDLDREAFARALSTFGDELQGGTVGVFYYAGHGLQLQGSNYLVPVDANPTRPSDADIQLVDANAVLHQMEDSGAKLKVVVLDACRNNPFGGRGLRAANGGLAQMAAPEGTLISYATAPGNVARDGEPGGDSPYTVALAQQMQQRGLEVMRMFNAVAVAVDTSTGHTQQPWLALSPISGEFYFAGQ